MLLPMSKPFSLVRFIPLCTLLVLFSGFAYSQQQLDPALYSGLRWRMIGPHRGGRTIAVSGVEGQPNVYYFGGVGGGVWKTTNGGITWEPIFDSQPISSIGAISVAPSNPSVIYVGTGEADFRSNLTYGNGVYKSTDGGSTWKNIGLTASRHISRIAVDPHNPDIVFVAAMGSAYGASAERGVFRSTDGGLTWQKVLFKDENTGAIDITLDPDHPQTVWAALVHDQRPPWSAYPPVTTSAAIYKSTDGGTVWNPVTGGGLPEGDWGRVGLAVARGTHGQRTDRRNGLIVKDRRPGNAGVGCLPHAAANAAEVINVWLALNAAYSDGASATVRADHSPAQPTVKTGIKLLGESQARENDEKYAKWDETHERRKNSHKQKHCIENSEIPSEARGSSDPEEMLD